jgi:4-amino-4-deoxy-L-arabinose transferase-like glycosyltransferase
MDPEEGERGNAALRWVKTYWPACTVAVGFVACLLLPVLLGFDDYFLDELYYLACAARPGLGYVDHPPLAPLLLGLVRAVLGDSLLAVRLLPAACGVATILLTARLAHIWGVGTHGQLLASLAVACAPVILTMSGFFSPNAIELLLWTGCWSALVEISRRDRMRDWLLLGALLGLGFENKHTVVTLAVAISFGLLVARGPKLLRQTGPWAGLALALALALPNLLFQVQHDWTSLEFYRIATFTKNISTPPLDGRACSRRRWR